MVLARSLKLPWAGVAATMTMAVGTAIAISVIAFVAVNFRSIGGKLLGIDLPSGKFFSASLMGLGGVVLALSGFALFAASFAGRSAIGF